MTRNILLILSAVSYALLTSNILGCYAEFDVGLRTPRIDPCTHRVEHRSIYVNPTCRLPTIPPQGPPLP